MRKEEVPQDDDGVIAGNCWFTYAKDGDGHFDLVPSVGWEPLNAANRECWQQRDREAAAVAARVHGGELSPLAYWMCVQQMDAGILAQLAGVARWRVRRHRRPKVFAGLKPGILARYARAFGIPVEELARLPAEPLAPSQWRDRQLARYDARLVDPAAYAPRERKD